jgi:hypothetical protein
VTCVSGESVFSPRAQLRLPRRGNSEIMITHSRLATRASEFVLLQGFTPQLRNNSGTIRPKSGPISARCAGVKARRTNKIQIHDWSDQLLSEIRLWRPAGLGQQDDITLIVIDVV